ncbi:uncharacterized protein LOC134827329 [Culicoides brevitarsis]|uniref:uncharacterized protein LOC134827329 n=1 Tax=Culicoides brevitarsis TaxID=469753 RepID=UPI00307BFBE8
MFRVLFLTFLPIIIKCAPTKFSDLHNINIFKIDDIIHCDELQCDISSSKCSVTLTTDALSRARSYEATCWIDDNLIGNTKIRHERLPEDVTPKNESIVMELCRYGPLNVYGSIDGKNINYQLGEGRLRGNGWKNCPIKPLLMLMMMMSTIVAMF